MRTTLNAPVPINTPGVVGVPVYQFTVKAPAPPVARILMMAVASSPLHVAVVARGCATIQILGILIATVAAREVMLLAAASVTITL
jgi:hypothetical protein